MNTPPTYNSKYPQFNHENGAKIITSEDIQGGTQSSQERDLKVPLTKNSVKNLLIVDKNIEYDPQELHNACNVSVLEKVTNAMKKGLPSSK